MSQNSQDKTEKATQKKLKKAREEGQNPRSKDLGVFALITIATLLISNTKEVISSKIKHLFEFNLHLSKAELNQPDILMQHAGNSIILLMHILLPLLCVTFFVGLISGALPGGPVFNLKLISLKLKKLNPIAGIGRMFSGKSIIELGKAFLKIALLLTIMLVFLNNNFSSLIAISRLPFDESISYAINFLINGILYLCGGLFVLAAIDIPLQIYQHHKGLKMSKQEVKDEHIQMEGKPEIKAKIRQIQQRMARSKADISVPTADAVLINPEHYSVALKYDPQKADAPYVVAKGVDDIAIYIRKIAKENNVEIVNAPPLTRAVYYSTNIDQQVPSALFVAIAHVISYVMQIKAAKQGLTKKPSPLPNFVIPEHLRHD